MDSITINAEGLEGPAPLYEKFAWRDRPQRAFIVLAECGEVSAYTDPEIGSATPERVFNGVDLRWQVPGEVNGERLLAFLAGPARPLLEAIHAGHKVAWDERSGRRHGSLDEAAQTAAEKLDQLIGDKLHDPAELDQVWGVGDWLDGGAADFGQYWPVGKSLAEAAADIKAAAAAERIVLDGDAEEELLDRALRLLRDGTPGLTAHHLDALRAADPVLVADCDEYAGRTAPEGDGPAPAVRLTPQGETKVLAWLAKVGGSRIDVPEIIADLRNAAEEAMDAGESIVYELAIGQTSTMRPEVIVLDAATDLTRD